MALTLLFCSPVCRFLEVMQEKTATISRLLAFPFELNSLSFYLNDIDNDLSSNQNASKKFKG